MLTCIDICKWLPKESNLGHCQRDSLNNTILITEFLSIFNVKATDRLAMKLGPKPRKAPSVFEPAAFRVECNTLTKWATLPKLLLDSMLYNYVESILLFFRDDFRDFRIYGKIDW